MQLNLRPCSSLDPFIVGLASLMDFGVPSGPFLSSILKCYVRTFKRIRLELRKLETV